MVDITYFLMQNELLTQEEQGPIIIRLWVVAEFFFYVSSWLKDKRSKKMGTKNSPISTKRNAMTMFIYFKVSI